MVWVFRVVRPVATVQFQVEPYPELTREIGPVDNTRHDVLYGIITHYVDFKVD